VEAIVERESVFEDFYRAERTTILRAAVYESIHSLNRRAVDG
jgi:hypothetical protein